MTTYHGFPIGDEARSTPAGMAWLDHMIAKWTDIAHRGHRSGWMLVSYYRELKVEALEHLQRKAVVSVRAARWAALEAVECRCPCDSCVMAGPHEGYTTTTTPFGRVCHGDDD